MKTISSNLFKALVVIPGLVSLIYPKLALASNLTTNNVSLSGDSLVRLESRTIKDDYKLFFPKRQNTSSQVFGNVQNYNAFSDQDDGVWQINDDVRLLVNEPLVERNNIIAPPQQDFYGGIDRLEVRTESFD